MQTKHTRISGLFTDLYELTMAQAYDAEHMSEPAVFELFFRKMPRSRNYMMAAGLNDVLTFLEGFQFTDEDIDYLKHKNLFSNNFLRRLRDLRFTGDVYAVAEGTLIFPNEPLIQVVAPIMEAQLVETFVLNQIHFQTVVASKAARVVTAAAGRDVVEFGARRAHGTDAALKVARASYIAGAVGTSNVLAGKLYGIPIFGTMAHSYVQAHDRELDAFQEFAKQFDTTTLLVDTYDTLEGVRKVIELANRLGDKFNVRAVRLDSGDLGELAFQTRRLLDDAGLKKVTIFASSGLDEYSIRALAERDAPIDAFGVGTHLAVSNDAPSLDMAYKLVEYAGKPRMKLSTDKVLLPGRKQIFRHVEREEMVADTLACAHEQLHGEPLLQPVMLHGRRTQEGNVSLAGSCDCAYSELARLPERLRSIDRAEPPYTVTVSDALQQQLQVLRKMISSGNEVASSAVVG